MGVSSSLFLPSQCTQMSKIDHVSHTLQIPVSFLCLQKVSRQQMPNCRCPVFIHMKFSQSGQMRFLKLCQLNTNISKTGDSKQWSGKNELD